jgi:hypothetical protein
MLSMELHNLPERLDGLQVRVEVQTGDEE